MSRTQQLHELVKLVKWAHNNAVNAEAWHYEGDPQRGLEFVKITRRDLVVALKLVDEILGVKS